MKEFFSLHLARSVNPGGKGRPLSACRRSLQDPVPEHLPDQIPVPVHDREIILEYHGDLVQIQPAVGVDQDIPKARKVRELDCKAFRDQSFIRKDGETLPVGLGSPGA